MSRRDDTTCTIRVCRDCCCGTSRQHPGVDHDGLLARLEDGAVGAARVSVSTCLLACDQSNVVVVSPSRSGREAGGKPVWVRGVLDDTIVDAVVAWVRDGGPGWVDPPEPIARLAFPPSGLTTAYISV